MADITNLRNYRKQRARSQKERAAEENRVKHGRTLAQKKQNDKSISDLTSHLDAHKLEKR